MTKYLDPAAAVIGVGASAGVSWRSASRCPSALGDRRAHDVRGSLGRSRSSWRANGSRGQRVRPCRPMDRCSPSEERWVRTRRPTRSTAIDRSVVAFVDAGPLQRSTRRRSPTDARRVLEDLRTVAGAGDRDAGSEPTGLDASRLSADLTRLTSEAAIERRPGHGGGPAALARRGPGAAGDPRAGSRRRATVLQARIESGALGLQQLAAQVSEMTALASPDGAAASGSSESTSSPPSWRPCAQGCSDAGAISRRALGAIDTEGGGHDPVAP